MDTPGSAADLQLQSHILMHGSLSSDPLGTGGLMRPTLYLVALPSKPSIGRHQRPTPRPEGGGAASPAAAQSLAGPGLLPDPGEKTARADTMDVAVVMRLGVLELSGMRWRATTLMLLDLHGHDSTLRLRFCSAASGSAIHRQPRVEKLSAVHPQCEAVLECG
jgi:hypothetical protein